MAEMVSRAESGPQAKRLVSTTRAGTLVFAALVPTSISLASEVEMQSRPNVLSRQLDATS